MTTTKGARAAIYIRISTGDQNPDLQRNELPEYCQRRGWGLVETYEDHMSGAKDRRPNLDRLLADVRRRKFDVVVVWRFDRFARSTSHLLRALEEFQSLGVDFVSLTEAIDTSTPAGKMVFTVLGAVAELERAIIRERVIAGQKAAKRRGVRFGRPNVAVPLAQIEKLRQKGLSWRVLEAQTGIAKDTLRRALMAVQTQSRSLT
jgi:DNA invertase Pin-like site-specific DNA recombinase